MIPKIRVTHTGLLPSGLPNLSSILLADIWYTGQAQQDRKAQVYVPVGGTVEFPLSTDVAFSFEQGDIFQFTQQGILTSSVIGGGGSVNTVFGRLGPDVVAVAGDYEASQVTNDSIVPGATVADALAAAAGGVALDYAQSIWVDPNGDPAVSGKNAALPTTLANAIATAAFQDTIRINEGVYADADGPGTGTLTIPQSNLTLISNQGGTGSNSVILTDTIIIPAGITRSRWYGLRFDGDINDNGSEGRHYFAACSAVGVAYNRTDPQRWVEFARNDFAAMTYNALGTTVAGATLTLRNGTRQGPINTAGNGHRIVATGNAILGRITDPSGLANTVFLAQSGILDPTLAIDAPSATLIAYGGRCTDAAGIPIPLTVGARQAADLVFNPTGSVGTTVPGLSSLFDSLQYSPAVPGDWAGPPPETIQEAIDRLAAANPGA